MSTSEDFDWKDANDRGLVVQQPVERVAIYSNPHDDIVIRQAQSWDEDRDTFIVIARAHAFAAARQILVAAGFQPREAAIMAARPDVDWEAHLADFHELAVGEEQKPKDTTAAERQRRHRANKARLDRDSVTDSVTGRDGELPLHLVAAE